MFESALYNYLRSVSDITDLIGTYGGLPAIFEYEAPENADLSYITFKIESAGDPSEVVEDFIIFIDYYDYNKSRENCSNAAKYIKHNLDHKILTHADYSEIRINYFSGSFVESDDTRDINYNLQFSGRGTRSGYMVATK